MTRRLVVTVPNLTEAQKAALREAAERHGFEALFFEDSASALPAARGAEVIFGQGTELTRAAPRLRWVCTPSAGVDPYLAPDAFAAPGAWLSNSSGAYGVTISEHVVMVTLELMRREAEYRAVTARRGWERGLAIRSICGSRVTILGTGDIGSRCAERLRGFGPARIEGVSRSGQASPLFDRVQTPGALDSLLPETDLLVLALPATAETAGVLSRARIALLPQDAFVVNIGRGSAVDEAALEEALRAGRLGGAALDVFLREPLPPESSLWDCPRLLITPHIAGNMTLGWTVEAILRQFLEDFGRYCEGLPPLRLVDRGKGY